MSRYISQTKTVEKVLLRNWYILFKNVLISVHITKPWLSHHFKGDIKGWSHSKYEKYYYFNNTLPLLNIQWLTEWIIPSVLSVLWLHAFQDYIFPQLHEIIHRYQPDILWNDAGWLAPSWYWNATVFLSWLYNERYLIDILLTLSVAVQWKVFDRYMVNSFVAVQWKVFDRYIVKLFRWLYNERYLIDISWTLSWVYNERYLIDISLTLSWLYNEKYLIDILLNSFGGCTMKGIW